MTTPNPFYTIGHSTRSIGAFISLLRLVADYLLARNKQVFHLMATDQIQPAKLTEGAKVMAN
jgi:uncharacterized protein (DUF488 family)